MKSLKYLPNIITSIRILLCIPIIFLDPLSPVSISLFMIAGFTDMIDGPLARRIKNGKSQLGAILDSIADMLLVIIGILVLLPAMEIFSWLFIAYVIGLAFKISSGFVGYFKHKEMVLLHTYSNKILAILLFLIPIFYFILDVTNAINNQAVYIILNIYIIFSLVCIFIITTEEILINLLLKKPSRDIRSIFDVKAANEALLKKES